MPADALRAEPRRDILTQTLALHALFQAGNEGGQFAFYTYVILTLLFMLVVTIPWRVLAGVFGAMTGGMSRLPLGGIAWGFRGVIGVICVGVGLALIIPGLL